MTMGGVIGRACALVAMSLAACTTTSPSPIDPETQVRVGTDPESENSLARQVWGLQPGDVLSPPAQDVLAELDSDGDAAEQDPEKSQDPGLDAGSIRSRFGSTVVIAPDGSVDYAGLEGVASTGDGGGRRVDLVSDTGY